MIQHTKYALLILVAGLSACGGGGGGDSGNVSSIQYSVTLTEVELNKKGSSETLAVSGLPAQSATLTQE